MKSNYFLVTSPTNPRFLSAAIMSAATSAETEAYLATKARFLEHKVSTISSGTSGPRATSVLLLKYISYTEFHKE